MDKLSALRIAIDEILEDDRVTALGDRSYEVRRPDGSEYLRVREVGPDEWAVFFESGHALPNSPRSVRPHELVAWALL